MPAGLQISNHLTDNAEKNGENGGQSVLVKEVKIGSYSIIVIPGTNKQSW